MRKTTLITSLVLLSTLAQCAPLAVNLEAQALAYPGEQVEVEVTLINIGNETIDGVVDVYVSEGMSNSERITLKNLLPGSTKQETRRLVVSEKAEPGQHSILASAVLGREKQETSTSIQIVPSPSLQVTLKLAKPIIGPAEENAAVVTLTNKKNTSMFDIEAELELGDDMEAIDLGFSTDELGAGKSLEKHLRYRSKSTSSGQSEVRVRVSFNDEYGDHVLYRSHELEVKSSLDVVNAIIIVLIIATAVIIAKKKKPATPFKGSLLGVSRDYEQPPF